MMRSPPTEVKTIPEPSATQPESSGGGSLFNRLRQDDLVLALVAIILVVDLLAFPWLNLGSFGPYSADLAAADWPDGWTAILAVIASLALIVDLGLERLAPEVAVPAVGGSRTMSRFVLAIVAAAFVALKFLLGIHFTYFGWGFYLGAVLTVALVYFATQARRAPDVPAARPGVRSAGPPRAGPPVA